MEFCSFDGEWIGVHPYIDDSQSHVWALVEDGFRYVGTALAPHDFDSYYPGPEVEHGSDPD